MTDFPHSLVDVFDALGNLLDCLNTAIVCDNLVLYGGIPKIKLDQVAHKVLVNADEFTRENSPCVDVRGEGFETLVVA